jgi:hypothetical protein
MANDELMALILGLPEEPLAPTRVELPAPERQEADPFERFQQDSTIAAALNSWADATDINAQKAAAAPELDADWDEVLADEQLEKCAEESPADRRKVALATHIKRRLALGESLEDLIAHARQHDERVALELQEVGAGL